MTNLTKSDQKHNLLLNGIHEFSWGFGIAFHSIYGIIPLFLYQLGAPQIIIVSVAGLFSILIAIPQMATAVLTRNIRTIKGVVIGVHGLVLPPVFIMAFVFAFLVPQGDYIWLFYYSCFILYGLAIGIIIPVWADFLNNVTNRETRGTFFGISFAINSLGGFFGGMVVKILFSGALPFPRNFGFGFIIMFFSILIGILMFFGYRMRPSNSPEKSITKKQFLIQVREILKNNGNFKRYLLARVFFTANFPAVSLYAVYCREKFNFDISEVGIFTVLNVISFGIASYFSGIIGDKYGHKRAFYLVICGHLGAVVITLLAQSMVHVYLIFISLGIGLGAFMPASMNLVYDFAGENDTKMFIAMIDTIMAPFILVVILIAGVFVSNFSPISVFIWVGIMLCVSLLLFTFYVRDPQIK